MNFLGSADHDRIVFGYALSLGKVPAQNAVDAAPEFGRGSLANR
jgi:hypothetical protein